jgi:hypothetical protein
MKVHKKSVEMLQSARAYMSFRVNEIRSGVKKKARDVQLLIFYGKQKCVHSLLKIVKAINKKVLPIIRYFE